MIEDYLLNYGVLGLWTVWNLYIQQGLLKEIKQIVIDIKKKK